MAGGTAVLSSRSTATGLGTALAGGALLATTGTALACGTAMGEVGTGNGGDGRRGAAEAVTAGLVVGGPLVTRTTLRGTGMTDIGAGATAGLGIGGLIIAGRGCSVGTVSSSTARSSGFSWESGTGVQEKNSGACPHSPKKKGQRSNSLAWGRCRAGATLRRRATHLALLV